MGTISNLMDRLARKSGMECPAIVVTAFGFTVGSAFVAWQSVSEIQGCRVDSPGTCAACLRFTCNGHDVQVGEQHPGFEQLENAMIAVFPSTADWRRTVVQQASAGRQALLYRRN